MPHWLDKVLTILQAQTADLRELAHIAGGDPRTFYRGISRDRIDLVGQDVDGMEFGDELADQVKLTEGEEVERAAFFRNVASIRDAGRAEERLAIIVRAMIEHRAIGSQLLKKLSEDRSKYARSAIRELTEVHASSSEVDELDPVNLMRLVRRHYVHAYPDSRAALIFYLAKHLHIFPDAKEYLRDSFSKSYSYAFQVYAQQIRKYLD